MPKSSSVSRATRTAFRAASILFALVTAFMIVLFVRALGEREIRTGVLTYAALTGATAIGLWLGRRWGRSLALITAMGNAGLGVLALLAVLIARRGPVVGPIVLLAISVAVAVWISRPVFGLPDD